jgi:hypothetical protein
MRSGLTQPFFDDRSSIKSTSPEARARKHERALRILHIEDRERPNDTFTLFNLGMTKPRFVYARRQYRRTCTWDKLSGQPVANLRR